MISRAKDFRSIQLELEMANGLDKSFDGLVKENIKKMVKAVTTKISARTPIEDIELEPCPECGSGEVFFLSGPPEVSPHGGLYNQCKVFCEDCAYETGWRIGSTQKEARIEAAVTWNFASLQSNSTPLTTINGYLS